MGQLGNGSEDDSSVPIEVNNISKATGISASSSTTCAVIDNSAVQCWGWDSGSYGLGISDSTTTSEPTSDVEFEW